MHLHRSQWLDVMGAVLTALCVVHCVALPIVVVALPFVASGHFEAWLGVVLVSVAAGAMALGSLTHRQWAPSIPFVVGLAFFFAAHTAVEEHSWTGLAFSLTGSACILMAHWLNFRASRAFGSCTIRPQSA